jgi:hypothetical protein
VGCVFERPQNTQRAPKYATRQYVTYPVVYTDE